MRFQASQAPAAETEAADPAATALLAMPEIDPMDRVVPAMGRREFHHFAEEVAVQVSIAMTYVGLEDSHDAVVMTCDLADAEEIEQDGVERVIHFRDEEETDLPVYVSVGIDGFVFVGIMNDDESVSIVSPPRTLDEVDELVGDIVAAVEREVPRKAIH